VFKWLSKFLDSNEKELKRLQPLVERVNSLEPDFQRLSDAELRALTDRLRARLRDGETLDDILPEAFAAVREAARRTLNMRHFDVQIMGGIVLHQGKIAEMKTGEGKTLAATLPLYLNSLTGEGCHLVTLNDYLAKRDVHWMGPIYHLLGVKVASIVHEASFLYDPEYSSGDPRWAGMRPISRREAYLADITYGTNHEFGFDYLRDNMALDLSQCVQRPLNYAIIDEIDNILIDEARTPLIISAPAEEPAQKYYVFARLVARLRPEEDYTIDEKARAVTLTDAGIAKMERWLKHEGMLKGSSLFDPANYALTYYLDAALKAHALYKRDRDYVVRNGEVIIVDEFTGRLMFGRRYAEGLHQAIEAKEGLKIQRESVTLATITLQNYFRMYKKLAGMTGTAATEAEEFHKIYNLEVVVIPTHKPMIRIDHPDRVYKTEKAKFRAVVEEIKELHRQGRPVLVGTTSIEKNEYLSELLRREGIPHQVLNAKHHEREAAIIAQAGRPGAVTVATNMAGRGVDILLGGNPERLALEEAIRRGIEPDSPEYREILEEMKRRCREQYEQVVALGGLHIIGTERHEARRIDNQLRGRAGRQGDPGSSRFYVSLEDDLIRRFGGERVKGLMEWAGFDEDSPLEHSWVNKVIENAQVKVEAMHFDMRKRLLEFDDVLNKHREVIYAERRRVLGEPSLKENVLQILREEVERIVEAHIDERQETWDWEGLKEELRAFIPLPEGFRVEEYPERKTLKERLFRLVEELYEAREAEVGPENMRMLERFVMLRAIDSLWVEHLTRMEHMRQGIGFQAYAQTDPLVAYKREAHELFQSLLSGIKYEVAYNIFRVGLARERPRPREAVAAGRKVGRNDPCPCGSGKKYKKCCGR